MLKFKIFCSGKKKWILYPPNTTPPGVFPSKDGWNVTTPETVIEWFIDYYRMIKNDSVKPIECILKPGNNNHYLFKNFF